MDTCENVFTKASYFKRKNKIVPVQFYDLRIIKKIVIKEESDI